MSEKAKTSSNNKDNHYLVNLDDIPALIWMSDKKAKPIRFNKAWLNFTGKTDEADAKRSWNKLIHEDDIKHCQKLHLTAHEQYNGYELKYRLWNEDNQKYRWIKEIGEPRFDENDKFLGFYLSCTDLQEQYDLIVNLAENEARYKDLYNKTPVMLHSINSDGRIIGVSEYWLETLGYDREEVLGMFSSEILTNKSKRLAEKVILPKFFEDGEISNQEYQLVKKSGEIVDVLMSAVAEYDKAGNFIKSLAVLNDVTDIKKSDAFLEQIYSITSSPKLTLKDKIYKILKTTTEFLGVEMGFISKIIEDRYTIKHLYAPDTDYAIGQVFNLDEVHCRHIYENDTIKGWEDLRKTEAAEYYDKASGLVAYIGMPIFTDSSKYGTMCFCSTNPREKRFDEREKALIQLVANWVGTKISIISLIGRLKESQEEMSDLVKELQESNGELERFAYIAAHDLQEPIRSMRNFTTLLSRKYNEDLDEEGQQYIDIIHDASTRMQKLVADLLDYSRIESEGKNHEEFELNDVLDYVQKNLMDLMRVSNATLNYETDFRIKTDPVKLSRLLQNLISNGIKYVPDDISPTVTVTCKENPRNWEFCVADNGIGIEEQYFEQIFAPFKRLHSKDLYPGSGIGLSICSKIAESLGGKIWVESEEHKGSKFFFNIPKTR